MARSQLALEKRAEKRSVPIEEQRLKDARKKSAKGSSADSGEPKTEKQAVVKKVEPVKDDNDWICTKCTNKNFHHRESCNRCQDSRENQRPKVTEVAKSITSEKPKLSTVKKVVELKAVPVAANQNWICTSCKNDNFPTRTTCNRCQTDKPTSSSSSVTAIVGVIKSTKPPTVAPKAPSDRIPKGMGIVSGKSLSWGKQATEKEIAENKRLLEAISSTSTSEENPVTLTSEELARAAILKERSLRKKEKKEQRIKWKAKKLSIKSGGGKVVKVASKIQKINQIRK